MQFRVLVGDITKWSADAIVNSASTTLLDVSQQDHALFKAAGLYLGGACRALRGCPEGEAKVTRGFKLPAKYIIHAVAPYWVGGKRDEEERLIKTYHHALQAATEKGFRHVAFMSLGTEDKRFPRHIAAAAAVPILLTEGQVFDRIDIVCVDTDMQQAYMKAAIYWWLQQLTEAPKGKIQEVIDAGSAALVLMPLQDMTPDPLVLADAVRRMHTLLDEFANQSDQTLVDKERTANRIMATYDEQRVTTDSPLDAVIKAYKDSKRTGKGGTQNGKK